METTITVSGMSCGHCEAAVRKAVEGVPGAAVLKVEIGSVLVDLDPGSGTLAAVEAAIEDAGYDVVKGRALNVILGDAGGPATDA